MLYARVATGSLPGNTNGIGFPPVQAESVTNHEAGLKSEFLERKGMIDLSVFYMDWKDIQIFNRDGFFLINGGTAVSQGMELASSWSPLDALRVGYNAVYTQAELTHLVPAAQYYLTGYQLPQVAKWSMSFTGDYDWVLTDFWHAHVGGAWRWIGPLWTLAVQSRSLGGGATLQLPGYALLDLNASIAKGSLALRVFVRNLADTRASKTGHIWTDPTAAVYTEDYLVQPRTIGVGIDYAF
jgi:outer membrane receptor protein involved in Fe transport